MPVTPHQIIPHSFTPPKKLCMSYLTDGECSLRVNCELCQVDTKLYNTEG